VQEKKNCVTIVPVSHYDLGVYKKQAVQRTGRRVDRARRSEQRARGFDLDLGEGAKKERDGNFGWRQDEEASLMWTVRSGLPAWIGCGFPNSILGIGNLLCLPLPPAIHFGCPARACLPRPAQSFAASAFITPISSLSNRIRNRNRLQAPKQVAHPSMAGGKSGGNAARSRKRVEATVLKRSRDGSAFTRW
jgi:hypothetical protein